MEQRILKINFNKPGGRAKASTPRLTLPATWVREMGITEEDREITVEYDGKEIVIRKSE